MRVLTEGVLDRAVVVFGADVDPDPELTWARGITLLAADGAETEWEHAGPIAVVGCSSAGPAALAFAERHAPRVDRVVLVATPIPEDEHLELSGFTAKTLLVYGAKDPATGSRHGTWWQRRLPDARLEMYPDGTHDLLPLVWPRALSHAAPRCRR